MAPEKRASVVIVGSDGVIHDPRVWMRPTHAKEIVDVDWANGRDVNCMTCLISLARLKEPTR